MKTDSTMAFQEHIYSVLVVSHSAKFNSIASTLFPASRYWPVDKATDAGSAKRALLEQPYDIILINTPLPDEFGTKLAIEICTSTSSCVMLLVKGDLYEDIYAQTAGYGVVTLSKPTSAPLLSQGLHILCATRERLKGMESRQQSVEKRIEEMRLMNKAKWLLIGYMKMTEEEAQHYIEKAAMNTRLSKKDVAENIIRAYQDYH